METGQTVVEVDFVKRASGDRSADAARKPSWWGNSNPGLKSDYRLIEPLTDRELHFLDHLAHGVSNKEIARALSVSENTVKFHLKNVYSKFAVRTRLQAIKAAYELGVLQAPDHPHAAMTRAAS